ncbi:Extended synaptotagmin-2, partial [Chamberlinius hualienensis]
MIQLLWPCIGRNVEIFIKRKLEPTIKQKFTSFAFDTIELGDTPAEIKDFEVYVEDELRNEIIMNLNVIYKGDCHFQVSSGVIKAGIKDFQFNGKIRVIMKPLQKKLPLIGGAQVYLLEKP